MKTNLPVTQREVILTESSRIISTTDTQGRITSINKDFLDISGFTKDELIGKPHNIIRHPDMPVEAFADLWNAVRSSTPWMGLVKNRCKNGDHYWVNAYVTPIYKGGDLVGYQSVRTKPDGEYVAAAEKLYSRLKCGKSPIPLLKRGFEFKSFMAIYLISIAVVGYANYIAEVPLLHSAAMLFVSAVFGMAVSQWQLSPLKKLGRLSKLSYSSDIACLAYKGNLTPYAQAEVALQAFKSQQVTLVELIQNSAQNLAEVVRNTDDIVRKNNKGISEQSLEISQLATAMNEMTATVQDVAMNAQETASKADSASTLADEGKVLINQTTACIEKLLTEVSQAGSIIHQLKEDTNNISNIIQVIDSIAEQTNLLALNAAIEAARAGESGRGFAVVADEVRSLASRTQSATSEIETTIRTLQQRAEGAVETMQVSQDYAGETVIQTKRVNETLHEIALSVSALNDMNTQIASATEEQSAVSEEINRNVTNIHNVAQSLDRTSEESSLASKQLFVVTEEMNSVVSQFRT